MNEKIKEICSKCEYHIHCQGKGCAFRSLGNEYCDEVENANNLINDLKNRLENAVADCNLRLQETKQLQQRIDKAIEYLENDLQSFLYSIEYKTLLEILKGDSDV